MTAREFCYWLQGYFELVKTERDLESSQVEQIKRHLALVFVHEIDPSYPGDPAKLQAIHDGKTIPTGRTRPDGRIMRC